MSSETITKNDLKNILDAVIPPSMPASQVTYSDGYSSTNLQSYLTPTKGTTSFSDIGSGMSVTGHQIIRWGDLRLLRITVKKTSATAVGSNIFTGYISDPNDVPLMYANGVGYYTSTCAVLQLEATGKITVRCTGAQLAANSEVWCTVVYMSDPTGGGTVSA